MRLISQIRVTHEFTFCMTYCNGIISAENPRSRLCEGYCNSNAVVSVPRGKVNNYTRGVISVLCGIGDVRSRVASLHGRSTGMAPREYFENTYRWHNVWLESGIQMNRIVSCGVPDVSVCTVYNVVVAVATNEGNWYSVPPIRSGVKPGPLSRRRAIGTM